jgi:hypothetical protein
MSNSLRSSRAVSASRNALESLHARTKSDGFFLSQCRAKAALLSNMASKNPGFFKSLFYVHVVDFEKLAFSKKDETSFENRSETKEKDEGWLRRVETGPAGNQPFLKKIQKRR